MLYVAPRVESLCGREATDKDALFLSNQLDQSFPSVIGLLPNPFLFFLLFV